ncbi:hypothetical protein [Burkholderia pseudomallei]|uniref:hypothetical protein n=1 Tax=Burkholderia pseudomallei TaxID=28450 RepID=UPI001E52CDED|nr:hypothetical protein [Burkholderia pseudomallei]
MKDRIEIDSREKKSAKKRIAFRFDFFRGRRGGPHWRRCADRRRAVRRIRPRPCRPRLPRRGIFAAPARAAGVRLPTRGRARRIEWIIRYAIARRNIRKYFQISCEYFCL